MIKNAIAAYAAMLVLALPACSGGIGGASVPAGGVNVGAALPVASQSVVVTAVFKGKPLAGLLITLSRNHRGGPVITKGRTGPMGRVKLSGSWTSTQKVCAWGVYTFHGGRSESEFCATPFPGSLTLDFS